VLLAATNTATNTAINHTDNDNFTPLTNWTNLNTLGHVYGYNGILTANNNGTGFRLFLPTLICTVTGSMNDLIHHSDRYLTADKIGRIRSGPDLTMSCCQRWLAANRNPLGRHAKPSNS
jgi:hypothetical protein